jgi:hypothetical protein
MIDQPQEPAGRAEVLRRLLAAGPLFVDTGGGLARLQIWTRPEWDPLEPAERPALAEYVDGLGWVVAVPVRDLN